VKARRVRRREGTEHELRHHRELTATSAPQRPEQVRIVVLVALDDAPVGEHGARGDELVRGEAMRATEDAQTAAEGQAGDPDGRPAAPDDGAITGGERVVDLGEARTGANGHRAVGDRHLIHAARVDDDAGRRRASGEAVAAAAQRHASPFLSCRCERLRDVLGHPTTHQGVRTHIVEASDLRPARRLVPGRARDEHVPAGHQRRTR
jgi:hypothetical protein